MTTPTDQAGESPTSPGSETAVLLTPQELDTFNAMIAREGVTPLPLDTSAIGTAADGSLVAYDAEGSELHVPKVVTSEPVLESQPPSFKAGFQTVDGFGSWLGGAARAFARAIVGCVAGVVGYDTVLSILEKRRSYWAFTRWLAGRVGWGLAITCASGAATGVLGW